LDGLQNLIDRKINFVFNPLWCAIFAASMPFKFGIITSINAISGERVSINLRASSPSLASPITSKPGWDSNSERIP
jgi:hypothetical protein